ncbi:MAG: hypothetical protein D6710_09570 [Nitrospirae bacterium]|nr:MAG: hypothetical protein D6710_09570 [Nitrospirota bacterium]
MGLKEAKRYIQELHKKQDNPFLWPNYLTGLPDRQAVLKKLDSVYPKIGSYGIAFVRIGNIHPYLLKYGYNRHSELIQWAAAILKTSCKGVRGSFVGTVGTHDFLLIAPAKRLDSLLSASDRLFRKKAMQFYNETDRSRGYIFSFKDDSGSNVKVGLMKLISYVIKEKPEVEKLNLIPYLERLCREKEAEEQKSPQ